MSCTYPLPQLAIAYAIRRSYDDWAVLAVHGTFLQLTILACFSLQCTGPYDFNLISNETDGRARVRLNGVTLVAGIN